MHDDRHISSSAWSSNDKKKSSFFPKSPPFESFDKEFFEQKMFSGELTEIFWARLLSSIKDCIVKPFLINESKVFCSNTYILPNKDSSTDITVFPDLQCASHYDSIITYDLE